MKKALVKPHLKKHSLDADNLSNYRPVSNLSLLSKLLEKAVDTQFASHLSTNSLLSPLQSAYRANHSVETALAKVHNDIMRAADESQGVLLILLDLSAAFDTIDHDMGIEGLALSWVESYLSDRQQAIHINGVSSSPVVLKYGVPQGSVKGPKDFICYTTPIAEIAKLYDVSAHLYADDTQLYMPFNVN